MMVPEELLKARMQYLREQRDKLLFKKNKERERQLKVSLFDWGHCFLVGKNFQELAISQRNRPFSSKVAARAVSQNLIDERKEIARKLKNEVINK
jgi:hypothetical protein